MKYLAWTVLAACLFASGPALAQYKPVAIATFSILADLTQRVAGNHAQVLTLVGPNGDAHVFEPGPKESAELAGADLLIANGLGFEPWLQRLEDASGFKGNVVVASDGVTPLAAEAHEEEAEEQAVDPHAFQDLANAQIYVANIAEALTEVDPEGAATYAANRDAYLAEIAALEADLAARLARIPEERRTVVTSHEAFGYLAATTGIRFLSPAGASTEADVSAQDIAALIDQIRAEGISAIFVENVSDPRLVERIAAETDAVVGGTLYSDALSEPIGDAPTYLDMMRHNIETLTSALGA